MIFTTLEFCLIYFKLFQDGFLAKNTQIHNLRFLIKSLYQKKLLITFNKLSFEIKTLFKNLHFFIKLLYSFIHISTLLFNYSQIKMTYLSWPPPTMNSIHKECAIALEENSLTWFVRNHWASGWLWWTRTQWREGLQAIRFFPKQGWNTISSSLFAVIQSVIQCSDAMQWYSAVVQYSDTVQWYIAVIQCSITVQWYSAVLQYGDTVQWYIAVIQCSITLQWYSAVIQCSDTVQWYIAVIQCSVTVQWYSAVIQCSDTVQCCNTVIQAVIQCSDTVQCCNTVTQCSDTLH